MTLKFTRDWTHSLNYDRVENQKLQNRTKTTAINENTLSMARRACQKIQSYCLSFCHFSPTPTSVESGGPLVIPHHLNPLILLKIYPLDLDNW